MKKRVHEYFYNVHYHWFWGMQHSSLEAPNSTAKQLMDEYLQDHSLLDEHINLVDSIYKKPPLLRGCYWLFNINNYAEITQTLGLLYLGAAEANDTSLLAAFAPLDNPIFMKITGYLYQRFSNFFNGYFPNNTQQMASNTQAAPPSEQETENAHTHTNTSTGSAVALSTNTSASASQQAQFSAPINKPQVPKTQTESFIVTQAMINHLQTLGFNNITTGQTLDFAVFRKAYKKLALKNHPDKAPDKKDTFIAIQTAHDAIKSILTNNENADHQIFKSAFDQMDEALDAIQKGIEKLNKGIAALEKSQENTKNAIDALKTTQDRTDEIQNRTDETYDRIETEISNTDEAINEFWSLLEQHQLESTSFDTNEEKNSEPTSDRFFEAQSPTQTLPANQSMLFQSTDHRALPQTLTDEIKASQTWKHSST